MEIRRNGRFGARTQDICNRLVDSQYTQGPSPIHIWDKTTNLVLRFKTCNDGSDEPTLCIKIRCGPDEVQWPPLGFFKTLSDIEPDDPRKEDLDPADHKYCNDQTCPARDAYTPN
jgi:hypothetical protein